MATLSAQDTKLKQNPRIRFCPHCGNILYLEEKSTGVGYCLSCPTCPLTFNISNITVSFPVNDFPDEKNEDIVDEKASNEHRQKTQVACPLCNHQEAYFYQMQTRSADEPMTNFYECCNDKCKHNWRD